MQKIFGWAHGVVNLWRLFGGVVGALEKMVLDVIIMGVFAGLGLVYQILHVLIIIIFKRIVKDLQWVRLQHIFRRRIV